jgi:hypothetical protein
MADCAIGQPSWRSFGDVYYGYGHSQAESCGALSAAAGGGQWRWTGAACAKVSSPSTVASAVQVCSPPEIKPGEVGPVTLTAACPASAPCVFSMFADGSIPTEITPSATVTAMAFGLGAVLSFFAIGYVIGVATGLIKKA